MVAIPGLRPQDVALVQSLLRGAGFECRVHTGVAALATWDVIFIREEDVPAVTRFLADYRLRDEHEQEYPIPW